MLLMLGYSANVAAVMAEQFPSEVRVTGISLPFAISVAAFGGTAPYIHRHRDDAARPGRFRLDDIADAAVVGTLIYASMR